MVLRKCQYIIVVDVSCDPNHEFEDLGNAIRKIRLDQNIEIEIDVDAIKNVSTENKDNPEENEKIIQPLQRKPSPTQSAQFITKTRIAMVMCIAKKESYCILNPFFAVMNQLI